VIVIFIPAMEGFTKTFKRDQLRYPRVRQAYKDKGNWLKDKLDQKGIPNLQVNIFIRAFKKERVLEVWIREKNGSTFIHFHDYSFCAFSGVLGPKRQQGDLQVPEGFYYIDRFNPSSNFLLSLGINYPNSSDRIKTAATDPGGDIFIHGNCVTIGCIPLTDDKIKELYILAVEARNCGQKRIPVHIFPARLNQEGLQKLILAYTGDQDLIFFWQNLKKGYDFFERYKKLFKYTVNSKGDYVISERK
jgi:murein L,D-transpeptidase YafK